MTEHRFFLALEEMEEFIVTKERVPTVHSIQVDEIILL